MATLVRFREPFREFAALHNEMNRLMNGLVDTGSGRSNQAWAPAVDVWETESELVYAFDLPGVARDSLAVEFEDGALTITAERAPREVAEERFYRFERRFGTFSRTIALPAGTTDEAISADYADGVLEVRVRKPEQPQPRRIAVGGGSEPQTIDASMN
jgi:HSP20 family protein